ncbi:MAG: beta-lactamase family protein [Saprospiraceae bacterium]|nr:beta-lactamase family protein [Saprospiraceae bacterium]
MKYCSITGFLMLCAVLLQSQTIDKAKLDNLFLNLEQKQKGMRCISIFEGGKEIYHFAIGYADVKSKIKPTINTKYKLGSVTKMFTATVIMQLVDEGKLRLNSTLYAFYPELPNARQITVEQLLKHNSGLTDKKFQQWQRDGKDFKLSKKSEYANVNYGLLSVIAEKVEKSDFGTVLRSRIFEPCNLKNTFYGNLPDSVGDQAKSYVFSKGWKLVEPGNLLDAAGAGAIVSTPSDVNTFLFYLFSGKIVSPKALAQMQVTVDGYGSGMMKVYFYEHQAYTHAGQIEGFQARTFWFPENFLSVTYCSNGVVVPIDDLLKEVLSICFKK